MSTILQLDCIFVPLLVFFCAVLGPINRATLFVDRQPNVENLCSRIYFYLETHLRWICGTPISFPPPFLLFEATWTFNIFSFPFPFRKDFLFLYGELLTEIFLRAGLAKNNWPQSVRPASTGVTSRPRSAGAERVGPIWRWRVVPSRLRSRLASLRFLPSLQD